MGYEREIDLARSTAREAAALALGYQAGIEAEEKSDHSPVTRADRECERLIAGALQRAFPEDGILGEEGSAVESRSGRRWIIDPIDGTRDYVRGNPLWGPLIALEDRGEVVAGVVHFPSLGGATYWACRGGGAFRDGQRLRVSAKTSAGESVLCINQFNKLEASRLPGLLPWMARFWAVRNLGGTPDAMMVASGQAEIWIEPSASPWDFAAPKILIEEAGGVFRNFDGGSSIYAGNAIALTPGLAPEIDAFLA